MSTRVRRRSVSKLCWNAVHRLPAHGKSSDARSSPPDRSFQIDLACTFSLYKARTVRGLKRETDKGGDNREPNEMKSSMAYTMV